LNRPTPKRRPRTNNQIVAPELRIIDETGKNLDVLKLADALALKDEKGLDLIEIAPNAKPPVAKIMDYGKYLYQSQKKEKEGRKGQKTDLKGIRFSIRTSKNDLEMRANMVDKFLKKRYKVKIQLTMRGREKSLDAIARKKMDDFLGLLTEPYKVEQEIKRFPMGMFMSIASKGPRQNELPMSDSPKQ
jgi:translation initiation factor IF-3